MNLVPRGARILLHACCGPCSLMPVRHLRGEGLDVTAYFFNPNIHPADEYERRRVAMRQVGEMLDLPVLFEPHCLAGYESEREGEMTRLFPAQAGERASSEQREGGKPDVLREGVRCVWCYRVRMEASARLAKARGFAAFSSSLLYSRYQHHELIVAEAERAARLFKVPFFYRDFRTYWQQGIDYSRELGIYRQKWCGCILSRTEAEAWKKQREERRAALRAARRAEHEANAARKRGRAGI